MQHSLRQCFPNNNLLLQPSEPLATRRVTPLLLLARSAFQKLVVETHSRAEQEEKPAELEQRGIPNLPLIKSDPSAYAPLAWPRQTF